LFLAPVVLLAAVGVAGCGGSGSGGSGTKVIGNTAVTLLATSTANGQLFNFTLEIKSLSLTSQDGKTIVALVSDPVGDDFIHLNGSAEPLVTNSIPQGVYTSATAIVAFDDPACAGANMVNSALATPQTDQWPPVTIKLPQPITVTGTAMALALDLQVATSAPFRSGCTTDLGGTVSVAPLFNLTAINASSAGLFNLLGTVGSVNAASQISVMSLLDDNAAHNPAWDFSVNGSTIYQGVTSLSQLAVGLPVDLDAVMQPDGSLLITRIEALDTNPTNVGVAYGPVVGQFAYHPGSVLALVSQSQGNVFAELVDSYASTDSGFNISHQLDNLAGLPFTPVFNAATLVDGQNVLAVSHAQRVNGFPPGPPLPVTSMTLMPQTINGTVSATGTAGTFTTYTVTLPAYDLFPAFASQQGQSRQVTAPDTIVVYVGADTRQLTSGEPSVGGVFRFTGLIFNDNGVLRMDCSQVRDGVPE
jgi:hypothetical protein